jgi:iron complex transport system ATP-binding protein
LSPVIAIDKLGFRVGGKVILDSISMKVEEGQYVSLVGSNGAGKTTLIKCVMGILTPSEGSIFVMGRDTNNFSQKDLANLISYVPQNEGRFIPFLVYDFVMMGRYPHLSPFVSVKDRDRRMVKEALRMTGTDGLADRYINTLSGGETQLVFIAAAISQGSRIMLLDEVTTFLDPGHKSDVLEILRRINREMGITIISVTHDINEAVLQSEKAVMLKEGRVMFEGKAELLSDNKILEKAYHRSFQFMKHPSTGKLIVAPDVGE